MLRIAGQARYLERPPLTLEQARGGVEKILPPPYNASLESAIFQGSDFSHIIEGLAPSGSAFIATWARRPW